MIGILERYGKKDGGTSLRIRFPSWPLSSGRTVYHVSVFPHLCSKDVCMEGNHIHVDTYDTREALEVLDRSIMLRPEQEAAIERLLEAQLILNEMTESLATLLPQQEVA